MELYLVYVWWCDECERKNFADATVLGGNKEFATLDTNTPKAVTCNYCKREYKDLKLNLDKYSED